MLEKHTQPIIGTTACFFPEEYIPITCMVYLLFGDLPVLETKLLMSKAELPSI